MIISCESAVIKLYKPHLNESVFQIQLSALFGRIFFVYIFLEERMLTNERD